MATDNTEIPKMEYVRFGSTGMRVRNLKKKSNPANILTANITGLQGLPWLHVLWLLSMAALGQG
jgi:hypothetical protein